MKLLLALLLFPVFSFAQQSAPQYKNDTLYTSCGYKIFKGQTLHFGNGTGRNGRFMFINIKSELSGKALSNNTVIVKKLSHFGISVLGNAYILVEGAIVFKDGSKGYIVLHMAFEKAIGNPSQTAGELIVPAEFRNKEVEKISISDEIIKLDKLYKDSIITKEEFEAGKKKLLENNGQ